MLAISDNKSNHQERQEMKENIVCKRFCGTFFETLLESIQILRDGLNHSLHVDSHGNLSIMKSYTILYRWINRSNSGRMRSMLSFSTLLN